MIGYEDVRNMFKVGLGVLKKNKIYFCEFFQW